MVGDTEMRLYLCIEHVAGPAGRGRLYLLGERSRSRAVCLFVRYTSAAG